MPPASEVDECAWRSRDDEWTESFKCTREAGHRGEHHRDIFRDGKRYHLSWVSSNGSVHWSEIDDEGYYVDEQIAADVIRAAANVSGFLIRRAAMRSIDPDVIYELDGGECSLTTQDLATLLGAVEAHRHVKERMLEALGQAAAHIRHAPICRKFIEIEGDCDCGASDAFRKVRDELQGREKTR